MQVSVVVPVFDAADHLRQVAGLLQRENEALQQRFEQLTREVASLEQQDAQQSLTLEIHRLQQRLDAMQRATFGDSSERRPRDGGGDTEAPKSQKGHGPRRRRRLWKAAATRSTLRWRSPSASTPIIFRWTASAG